LSLFVILYKIASLFRAISIKSCFNLPTWL